MNSTLPVNISEVGDNVAQISRRFGLTQEAQEELYQETVLAVASGKDGKFWLRNSVFSSRRRRRICDRVCSISTSDMTIHEEPRVNNTHSWELNEAESYFFICEIHEMVASLPHEQRKICRLLMFYSPFVVAKKFNQHPTQMRRKIDALQNIFKSFLDSL
ncbi:MAG: hypothetical protein ACRC2T_11995 [Thermoguttaceae bacterium]